MAAVFKDDDDPGVMVRQSRSDLRLLKTGGFSDFTIICGGRQWKAHKAILSRAPYFKAIESVQEEIIIEAVFEPFEIQWLLEYIYFPYFNPESALFDTPQLSYLETTVRLWQLGDYFQVRGMTEQAAHDLSVRCDRCRIFSRSVDKVGDPTTLLVDIECAIRRAWREDLASDPLLRERLVKLCVDFSPYLKHHKSFLTLLEDVPEFTIAFSQQALGTITSWLKLPMPPGSPKTTEPQKEPEDDTV